uniref:Uncharacterized protein n=1 Tax=Maylandia zebra TaxID=106582 RepID=A0A3P9CVD7_9CICH
MTPYEQHFDDSGKEKLPFNRKKPPVKQIMEEAVTKKFVHEDSSHIIRISISSCLLSLSNCNLHAVSSPVTFLSPSALLSICPVPLLTHLYV